jgi:adenosylcobinamide hydrolase
LHVEVLRPQLRRYEEDGRRWPVLVWTSRARIRSISSAPFGGGVGPCSWVLNAQVPLSYSRCDPQAGVAALAAGLGLDGPGVGMLTAAEVSAVECAADGGVEAAATVGLRVPTWAAAAETGDGRPGGAAEVTPVYTINPVGTINIVAMVPERLSEAALVNAVGTVTEAKTQALGDAGIEATGTATDAVCICCPEQGAAAAFGGPRSRWGAPLARAVHAAVLAGARGWASAPS